MTMMIGASALADTCTGTLASAVPPKRLVAEEKAALEGSAAELPALQSTLGDAYARYDREGDLAGMADSLGILALASERRGDLAQARRLAERAVGLAAASDSRRLHDWLWLDGRLRGALGDTGGAFASLERAIERIRRMRTEVEEDLAAQDVTFRQAYGALYIQYAERLVARAESAEPQSRSAWLHRARDAVETTKAAEVAEYFRDPCIGRTARAALEVSDRGAAVLYYLFLPARVVALVSYQDTIELVPLAARRSEIETAAQDLRRFLEKRSTRQYLRPAQRLHDALIKPLAPLLDRLKPSTLVIVPDGALRTIPFAALHDGQRFVAQRYAVATAPGLSLTQPRALTMVSTDALVLGLTQARHGFSSLPAVADEVRTLRDIVPSRVAMDEGFVRGTLLAELSGASAEIVHIASHGQFGSSADQSFILAYDGPIGFGAFRDAIRAGTTRPNPIEILTLSACQTAAGDERAALGLAGIAVQAGARSAVASLWSVSDESTAMLITSFYRHAVTPRMPRAEALRSAQLEMLAADRFTPPAYWAPFLVIGSWL